MKKCLYVGPLLNFDQRGPGVPLLNIERDPWVPLLNLELGPLVPLLNLRGAPFLTFKRSGRSWVVGS